MNRMTFGAALVAGLACRAPAEIISFQIYENADGADVSGLDLTVELVDGGTFVDFIFRNESATQSVITAIYFEDTIFSSGVLSNAGIQDESAGVDFSDGATPPNPAQPGLAWGGSWDGTFYSADAEPPPADTGINASVGESMTIRFDYDNATFDELVDALLGDPADYRIAMHVQSVGDNELSVWGITTVPSPAGSIALLSLGGLVAARRRH